MSHPYFDIERPIVLGHRGAAGDAPENTLVAFERGLALGAQIIESDIHGTRDGVPVLIHDPEVARARVIAMVEEQAVTSRHGKKFSCRIDSICVHGDEPTSVNVARAVREGLEQAGIEVVPLPQMDLN